MPKFQDLTGQTFHNWEVLYLYSKSASSPTHKGKLTPHTHWMCRCICGVEKPVVSQSLKNGKSKSCGCLKKSLSSAWRKGVRHTPEAIAKMKAAKKEYYRNKRPEDHPNWKGGKTPLMMALRCSTQFEEWRQQVFERDGYHCRSCGNPSKSDLNAHHLAHFARLVIFNDIETIEQGLACEVLWKVGNGLTLCKSCHEFLHSVNGY